MGFTEVTLTGNYGASASGVLTFTLTESMANSGQIVVPEPKKLVLNGGSFSVVLPSNVDSATTPAGTMWGVTEQITGAQPRDYFIEIPAVVTDSAASTTSGSEVVALTSITPAMWMQGLPVSGPGIPANTTVSQVMQQSSQLQLSAPATATATGVSLSIGTTTIDISALMPTETGWL